MWRFDSSQRHKTATLIYMWFLFFLFLSQPVFAQDSPDLYAQYRTDYLYQRDLYQQNYTDYLNKKDTYAQYGSLDAEKDKIAATKNVFQSQNSLLKSYLMALRVTLNGSSNNQEELKKWEDWLSTQNQLVPNLNSTLALKNWANTFNSQYVYIQSAFYSGLIQGQINRRLTTLSQIKTLAQDAQIDWSNLTDKEKGINDNFQLALDSTKQNQRLNYFSNFYPDAKEYLDLADLQIGNLLNDLKSLIIKSQP